MIFKRFLYTIFICAVLCSCHSKRNTTRWEDPIYARRSDFVNEHNSSYPQTKVTTDKTRKNIIDAACNWLGVPYLYGGNTKKGVDCSGLVCMAYREGANIALPRTSTDQASHCKKITREKALPGDLIFFVSSIGGSRINHVAIYLGESRIIHSTSSKGVIISDLNDDYWKNHFHSCGRAL